MEIENFRLAGCLAALIPQNVADIAIKTLEEVIRPVIAIIYFHISDKIIVLYIPILSFLNRRTEAE
jgi:hypothetical protein